MTIWCFFVRTVDLNNVNVTTATYRQEARTISAPLFVLLIIFTCSNVFVSILSKTYRITV